jgi:hypothetical protein
MVLGTHRPRSFLRRNLHFARHGLGRLLEAHKPLVSVVDLLISVGHVARLDRRGLRQLHPARSTSSRAAARQRAALVALFFLARSAPRHGESLMVLLTSSIHLIHSSKGRISAIVPPQDSQRAQPVLSVGPSIRLALACDSLPAWRTTSLR